MPILTPETHPDHDVIGRTFQAFGNQYVCDSLDTRYGYWMTPANPDQLYPFDKSRKDERRNVSERAIGRTYHRVYKPNE